MALADNLVEVFRAIIVFLILGYATLAIADALFFNGAIPIV